MIRRAALVTALAVGVVSAACGRDADVASLEPGTRTYRDRAAGFSFDLPAAWTAHYRIRVRPDGAARAYQPTARHAVLFTYVPTAAAMEERTLVAVLLFDDADWDALSSGPGPQVGHELARRGGRVFVARLPAGNPFDAGSDDAKLFESMRVSLDQVKAALIPDP
jgi:hypothetical protein